MSSHEAQKSRGHRAGLTRERVAAAALRIIDRDGLGGLSMRSVGAELGVQAMSLYNHVADKDDLLDAVADLLVAAIAAPPPDLSWDDTLRAIARELRAGVLAHPAAAPLIATRPLGSRGALTTIEATLAALRRSGLDDADVVNTFWLLTAYLTGALLSEAAARTEQRPVSIGPTGIDAAAELPTLTALAPLIRGAEYAVEYERGLDRLLAALTPRA